jgi:hypothetical protein
MSNFSNDSSSTAKSVFKTHHIHDSSTSLFESKQIADGYSENKKWQHRASVTVVGTPDLRPYDPIYLDGLPNGMSGYWTILSTVHVFGGAPANYMVMLEVGTDLIGDTDTGAAERSRTRDIQSELSGQALIQQDVVMVDVKLSPNASSFNPSTGSTAPTAITSSSSVQVPNIEGATLSISPPTDTAVKFKVQYRSKKRG